MMIIRRMLMLTLIKYCLLLSKNLKFLHTHIFSLLWSADSELSCLTFTYSLSKLLLNSCDKRCWMDGYPNIHVFFTSRSGTYNRTVTKKKEVLKLKPQMSTCTQSLLWDYDDDNSNTSFIRRKSPQCNNHNHVAHHVVFPL